MIKFKATIRGRDTVGFVLEPGNLRRLREGHAIHIFKEEMDLPFDIYIDFNKDPNMVFEQFKKHGAIGPDTIVHDERERKKQ